MTSFKKRRLITFFPQYSFLLNSLGHMNWGKCALSMSYAKT
jgi:hypothetical protein